MVAWKGGEENGREERGNREREKVDGRFKYSRKLGFPWWALLGQLWHTKDKMALKVIFLGGGAGAKAVISARA